MLVEIVWIKKKSWPSHGNCSWLLLPQQTSYNRMDLFNWPHNMLNEPQLCDLLFWSFIHFYCISCIEYLQPSKCYYYHQQVEYKGKKYRLLINMVNEKIPGIFSFNYFQSYTRTSECKFAARRIDFRLSRF